jgi:hypothetical protein
MLRIRIQAIVVSNDSVHSTPGPSQPASAVGKSWGDYVKELVDDANALYEDQEVGFRADFHPATDVAFVSSTLLNRDDNPTSPALDPNGNAAEPHERARQVDAWKYPGRVVIFLRDFDPAVADDSVHSTGSYGDYVYFDKVADDAQGSTLAHELCHFFHVSHTFDLESTTVADAAEQIRTYVEVKRNPVSKGLDVFDGDAPTITDTPPDAGWKIYDGKFGSRCSGPDVIPIFVNFQTAALSPLNPKRYDLKPDRTNLMSYFSKYRDPLCTAHRTLSPMQKSVMEAALRTGNRNGLLHTAAMMSDNGKAYFFKADRYLRYDINDDRADQGYPKQISDGWPGLWPRHVDAAAVWPDGRTYFFKGDEYVKYDRENRKVFDGYPKKIKDHWPGVWWENLDAVLVLDHKTAYFFKESECQRYDIETDKAVGERQSIASRWQGVWGAGIDAALAWDNGKVYFLKGDQYARYDLSQTATDQDFRRIEGFWPGLFFESIDAAVVWNDGSIRFVSGNQYINYNILGDEAREGYPHSLSSVMGKDFPWNDGFDAAAVWNNGKAYFFKDSQYVRLDLETKKMDRGPRLIGEGWEGLGNEPVDAVVLWNNGKAYFFRGDHYFQVDPDAKKVIAGPLSIAQFWQGVFKANLDGVIVLWDRGKAYFFKGNEYIRYDVAADRADAGYPARLNGGGWPGLRWD